jgi:2-polyprenyl-6-methoxyphenol hydroxylase-like FAD-dependent oxidoreductase
LIGASFNSEGRVQERELHCGLLLATDGARSTVRELAGISMEGERDLQKLVSVHFHSRYLGRYLSNERPGMLFFIFNPNAIGVLVAHDLEHGEFVLQVSETAFMMLEVGQPM